MTNLEEHTNVRGVLNAKDVKKIAKQSKRDAKKLARQERATARKEKRAYARSEVAFLHSAGWQMYYVAASPTAIRFKKEMFSIVGAHCDVSLQTTNSSHLTATRVATLGVFALAAKKQESTSTAHVVVTSPLFPPRVLTVNVQHAGVMKRVYEFQARVNFYGAQSDSA